jgi:AmmeMemoRadiSam system protein B
VKRRPAAVAGLFYPDDPRALSEQIDAFLSEAESSARGEVASTPKALIGPHAGTRYSGPIAGSAYARLLPLRERIERVVLLGPSHRVAVRGLAASSADAFTTPLGDVPVDRASVDRLASFPAVRVQDEAHRLEHSLELHLPFLQRVLARFSLVPFSVGHAAPEEVSAVLEAAWGGSETLIVVSSDLSHYHDYGTAQRLDRETSRNVERLAFERIDDDHACGAYPVRGLLRAARGRGLRARTVDLRNSGDTAPGRQEVVGYGAYLFE